MAHTVKTLTKNLLSQKTFDQVSYFGTLCGDIVRRTGTLQAYKSGNCTRLPIQVETQYYYYLSRVWKFVIVTESAHGYRIGDIVKAGWQMVEEH